MFLVSDKIVWAIHIVRENDYYGRNNQLIHKSSGPLIEFYDTRYPFVPFGQFVSRYYYSTLANHPDSQGLILDTACPEWQLTANTLEYIKNELSQLITSQ